MLTPLQLRLIHLAYRQAGLAESHYRLILQNVAGAASAKDLTQPAFEDVMSVLEDSGFRETGKPEDYWRSRVATRGSLCGPRMVHKIMSLRGCNPKYPLPALCQKVSGGRVSRIDRLTPLEAYALVEMLKAIAEREAARIEAAEAAPCPPETKPESGMNSEASQPQAGL